MAKQVLASSFYYHASFLMPSDASDALLAKIVVSIDRFVAKGCLEEGPIRPLITLIHMSAQQGSGVPALGHGGRAAGGYAGQSGGHASASAPPCMEGADAAGLPEVRASPWARSVCQHLYAPANKQGRP